LDDEDTLEADSNEQKAVVDNAEDAEDEDDELPPHLDLSQKAKADAPRLDLGEEADNSVHKPRNEAG